MVCYKILLIVFSSGELLPELVWLRWSMVTRTLSTLCIVLEDVKITVISIIPGPSSMSSQVAGRRNTGSESLCLIR